MLPQREVLQSRAERWGLRSSTPRFSPEKQETMLNSEIVKIKNCRSNHKPTNYSLGNDVSVIFYPDDNNVSVRFVSWQINLPILP